MSAFEQELKVIPRGAWVIAALLFIGISTAFLNFVPPREEAIHILIATIGSLVLGAYALVVGYINGDARRRGMRHVMWTLLAIFIPNAIGIILYFILRDPMPVHCGNCGASMKPIFAFCPRCGSSVQPACPQCRRPVDSMWTNCAYCGAKLHLRTEPRA